jgi:amino acid permease
VSTYTPNRRLRSIHCRQLGCTVVRVIILVSTLHLFHPNAVLKHYYRDIPLVLAAYLIWRYWKGTKIVSLSEIPLEEAFRQAEQAQDDEYPVKSRRGLRFISWIWD